ncbi:putative anti-sigma regulatory factor, serine/threonine protein kinase [Thermoclostridium stercorarium subsp. stercorarium DSM 8532]|uniref:Anti-sigma regulatory factor n=3 Tax=Thermoclostridium stercorarium TaxID=1510 RepID=A0A1B1YIM3_THEST|nr:ATP-binding protein [Thermoclostridium stercorarium]AGC67655.1 putative anti-sigma regulatory factor, serine/threonine protein kinase [Thermoclostridium stercorarium subsp. stercorarium DSM 8532]AGI38702.1 anti-sigma regulator [Thermoclostridium stercorarium subsp. stercorarium DSM 8532]ANW98072.1 anti-sigma regulatory factor [Thermoclostridium stercorarium subsp. thermolacticum DSM 2910]ANX00617.1 anti-sigma regulatory factor [Thermoclostridium stercorarium subsp. leptospartum DSM 9219]
MSSLIRKEYDIPANDFSRAGEASSNVRKLLTQLGVNPTIIKRTSIAMYEAELNAVIHGNGGKARVEIFEDRIEILVYDEGPGIADIELAMQEGYSTAPDYIREMGFGAGMGLSNIKKNSDKFVIESELNKGTRVYITIYLY